MDYRLHLNNNATQKVSTGTELVIAADTVADVSSRLTLYRLKVSVILERNFKEINRSFVNKISSFLVQIDG